MRVLLFVFLFWGAHGGALAALCDDGYYPVGGVCTECGYGYYCRDDIRNKCPDDTTDWIGIFGANGHTVPAIATWAESGDVRYTTCWLITQCRSLLDVYMTGGRFHTGCPYNVSRGDYYCDSKLWYQANPGYYLSGYWWSNYEDWYYYVKPCTNAIPEYSHYSGAGTPNTNDCPWECDNGYAQPVGRNECLPLCAAGITTLNTSTGLKYNLWQDRQTVPSLVVQYNRMMCYANMIPGVADNSVNILFDGKNYHVSN